MRNTRCYTHKRQIILAKIAILFSLLLGTSVACSGLFAGNRPVAADHEQEGRQLVIDFESKWSSLEAHKDSNVQAEVATDPYLKYVGYGREGKAIYDEPFWLVTKSALVKSLTVLEYSAERFKIMAHIVRQIDETTPNGELRQSFSPAESCRVYAFAREGNTWKVAAVFDMTNINNASRDWRDAPDWLRLAIGDLPQTNCTD